MVSIGNNRMRLRRKDLRAKFKDDGRKGVTVFELSDTMPVQSHMCCEMPKCGHFLFHAEYSMDGNLLLSCDKCHHESLIKGIIFSESRIAQGIVDPQGMMPGGVRCPRDNNKKWVIWKASEDLLMMGCKTCAFQWQANLWEMGNVLRDEFKYAGKIII